MVFLLSNLHTKVRVHTHTHIYTQSWRGSQDKQELKVTCYRRLFSYLVLIDRIRKVPLLALQLFDLLSRRWCWSAILAGSCLDQHLSSFAWHATPCRNLLVHADFALCIESPSTMSMLFRLFVYMVWKLPLGNWFEVIFASLIRCRGQGQLGDFFSMIFFPLSYAILPFVEMRNFNGVCYNLWWVINLFLNRRELSIITELASILSENELTFPFSMNLRIFHNLLDWLGLIY